MQATERSLVDGGEISLLCYCYILSSPLEDSVNRPKALVATERYNSFATAIRVNNTKVQASAL
jgi:hypothetical protein